MQGGFGPCPSLFYVYPSLYIPLPLGKWKIAHQFFAGNGKGVTMANGLPLLEGLWEGGLAVCPSALERWTKVAMAMGMLLV